MTEEKKVRILTAGKILILYWRGYKQDAIARKLKVGQATVSRVVRVNIFRRQN